MKRVFLLLGILGMLSVNASAKKVHNRIEIGNDSVSTRVLVRDSVWNDALLSCKRNDTIVVVVGASEYNDQDKSRHSSIEEMEINLLQMSKEAKKKHVQLLLVAPEGDHIGGYGLGVERVEERMTRKE